MRGDSSSIGLLLLRIGMGAMLLFAHGWPKLLHFGERAGQFANPIGVGPQASLVLVVFAEVLCAALVIVGLFTRFALVPLLVFFFVAVFIQHGQDPFGRKELAIAYGIAFLALLFTGPGRYSLDARLRVGRRRRKF